jgi:metal-dependent amidase/aminoacylase/carboxypeptidase family protein
MSIFKQITNHFNKLMKKTVVAIFLGLGTFAQAQLQLPVSDYEKIEAQVIEWRHDIHQNPELSNQEFKTAAKIAAHLKSLGIEVTTGVAKTGVVGILKGDLPGKVVALRADIDALPVTERNDLSF